MKNFLLIIVAVFSNTSISEDRIKTYQTHPNSNIPDYRVSAYVTEGNTTYKTLPNSSIRDYRAPSYVTQGSTTYQTLPNSNIRDYTAPAYVSTKGKK